MNIFEGMKVVFNGPSCESITRDVSDFWKLCAELKLDLGKKGYYLDEYLSKIFETLARFDLVTVGEMASGICWRVQSDCYILCGTEEEKEKSEFFDISENYINKNPVDFSDRHTQVQFYAGNILIEHLNIFAEKVKSIYRENALSEIDYPISDNMYEKISYLIGERRMEILNEKLCEAFVVGPVMVSVVQQIVVRALQMLCYRDPESSKMLYQFMLEEKFNG